MRRMRLMWGAAMLCLLLCDHLPAYSFRGQGLGPQEPLEVVKIEPIRKSSFDNDGQCRQKSFATDPQMREGILIFRGIDDGDRQVDPQIAVGPQHVLQGTNTGLYIFDKNGQLISGVNQRCFNQGIDPKLFYSRHHEMFGFDLWNPWDEAKQKPVNIAVSQTADPTQGWNIYPVPAPRGVDGGGIGYSRQWVGYSFPGGDRCTFVMKAADLKAGVPADAYFFEGSLGHPVLTQDPVDELYFFAIEQSNFVLRRVVADAAGNPRREDVFSVPHRLEYVRQPPGSPQAGTDKTTASGDRNPKNLVIQGGFLWFSHTVNCEGRAAVQWHQLTLKGETIQRGLLKHPQRSYIQTTIAVNQQLDVLVGFQETGPDMFISPRFAFRQAADPPGELREMVSLGEGQAATAGGPWGDYSGSVVDGGNGLDLWTIQSIAGADGKGDTVIARLPLTETPRPVK